MTFSFFFFFFFFLLLKILFEGEGMWREAGGEGENLKQMASVSAEPLMGLDLENLRS